MKKETFAETTNQKTPSTTKANNPEQDEAYYVKCDAELNDETSRNNGLLVAEIGYSKKKPAEFVVIRIVQKSN